MKLHLLASRLESLKTFYTGLMELPLLHQSQTSFAVSIGHSLLSFQAVDINPGPTYHFAFNIPHGSIENALKWLNEHKIEVIRYQNQCIVDFPNWGAKSVYFFDPAGNVAELIDRQHSPPSDFTEFTPGHLQCISEVGMPLNSWPASVHQLKDQLNLPVYKAATHHFVPLGSPGGLLIAVPVRRQWFPTSTPCLPFPATIHLQGKQSGHISIENYDIYLEAA